MKKQSPSRYSSLINRIALTLLVSCILIYFLGRIFSFSKWLTIAVGGYTIIADIIFLTLECVVTFLVVYFIPVKIFDYMQGNSFKEKCIPVPKSILSKDLILPVFALGLCAQFVGYAINSTIVGAFTEYTGFGDEYVFFSGMKHGYQIVIYIISIAVIPAIFEELIFRKTFCDALAPYGPKTAIFVTSILFSLMHTSFERIFHTFICGLFCSWLYIGTKNIKLPMLLHFLNNFFAAIEVVLWYRVSEDAYSTARVARLVISLVVSIVCFIYLRAKRREQLDAERREAKSSDTYDEYLEKKKKYAHYTEMLPDENGEEVVSLSTKQKISGFFSPAMIAFIVAIFIQMCYYLSFELV